MFGVPGSYMTYPGQHKTIKVGSKSKVCESLNKLDHRNWIKDGIKKLGRSRKWPKWGRSWSAKGRIISKWFFGVFDFLQKTNENKSTWGIMIVKSNFFVRFLEEIKDTKNSFEIIWLLIITSFYQVYLKERNSLAWLLLLTLKVS